jgi:shikimate kinase
MMNIALIGFRCSGKTVVGRKLAEMLESRFVDLDDLIADTADATIGDIFQKRGESVFRDLESATLKNVLAGDNQVIGCGGGIVLRRENIEILRGRALVVWLKATGRTCAQRMLADEERGVKRPSLTGAAPVTEISELLAQRLPLYESARHFHVDTDRLTVDEAAIKIRQHLQTLRKDAGEA